MKTETEVREAIQRLDFQCRNPWTEDYERTRIFRAIDALKWTLDEDSWLADTLAGLAKDGRRPA